MTKRRGACPSFSAPMQTGDGLLARLHPSGPILLDAFAGLCRASQAHGNGIMEVTQRGSIQVRGLRAETVPGFTADVRALDFDAPEGVVVSTPPLSPRSLALAAVIREAIDAAGLARRLAAKTTVIVDAGDGLSLDDLPADLRFRAVGAALLVGIGTRPAQWLGAIAPEALGEVVVSMLSVLAAAGREVRARDLGAATFRPAITRHLVNAAAPGEARPDDAVGGHGAAYGVGLPFGSADAAGLLTLLSVAGRFGADRAWAAPGRALIFETVGPAFAPEAAELGFVVDPHDPRRRVQACTGAPRCASGLQAVRLLAAACAGLLPEGVLHLSGCSKGCAYPAKASLTLVGGEAGFGVVRNGRPDDMPIAWIDPSEVLTKLPDLLDRRRPAAEEPAVRRGRGAGRG